MPFANMRKTRVFWDGMNKEAPSYIDV